MGEKKEQRVTESPVQLFGGAEFDLVNIFKEVHSDVYDLYLSFNDICYKSAQAAEKYLKGYLVENKADVRHGHNVELLWEDAFNINNEFKKIEESCGLLNNYQAKVKYDFRVHIVKDDVVDVLKALKEIYEFEPMKKMREYFKENVQEYKKFPDINMDTIITIVNDYGYIDRNSIEKLSGAIVSEKIDDDTKNIEEQIKHI